MKFISVPIFIVSLAFGLFFVYITNPEPTTIIVYPTPDNVDKVQYKDKAGTCYTFKAHETICPSNKSNIKQIPVQN